MVPTASDHAEEIGVRQNGSHKRFEEGPTFVGAIPIRSRRGNWCTRQYSDSLKQNSSDPQNCGTVPTANHQSKTA